MANFDIAVGINTQALNKCVAQLFTEPTAQKKYFTGSQSAEQPGVGNVTLTYSIITAPTFVLSPPTQANWDAAIKQSGTTTMPSANLFQLLLGDVKGSATIGNDGTPTIAEGPLTVYLTVVQNAATAQSGATLQLNPVAVLINEAKFSEFDKWLTDNLLAPIALSKAASMLTAFHIPGIPAYDGVQINTPVLFIGQNILVAAATISQNQTPLNTDGVVWQTTDVFAVLSPLLINTALVGALASYQNYSTSDSGDAGGSTAWVEGSYDLSISSVTATVETNPTQVAITLTPDVSVTGSFGGYAVAAVCPVGAALSAM